MKKTAIAFVILFTAAGITSDNVFAASKTQQVQVMVTIKPRIEMSMPKAPASAASDSTSATTWSPAQFLTPKRQRPALGLIGENSKPSVTTNIGNNYTLSQSMGKQSGKDKLIYSLTAL